VQQLAKCSKSGPALLLAISAQSAATVCKFRANKIHAIELPYFDAKTQLHNKV
jgi:hypothetical protein